MQKNGFTIIEVVVVFLLILAVTFFVFPKSLDNTRQAKLISKWTQKYSELQYMFSVINAQQDGEIQEKTIKSYLRITSKVPSNYKQYYMNKQVVPSNSEYYFNEFYLTGSGEIVGLKLINEKCKTNVVCAIITFDVNGLNPPNTWGYDVFGINVFKEKIEPLGKDINSDFLKLDCSKKGSGVYCSYYYLIGGRFD